MGEMGKVSVTRWRCDYCATEATVESDSPDDKMPEEWLSVESIQLSIVDHKGCQFIQTDFHAATYDVTFCGLDCVWEWMDKQVDR